MLNAGECLCGAVGTNCAYFSPFHATVSTDSADAAGTSGLNTAGTRAGALTREAAAFDEEAIEDGAGGKGAAHAVMVSLDPATLMAQALRVLVWVLDRPWCRWLFCGSEEGLCPVWPARGGCRPTGRRGWEWW
jgi:hypothetical protein